MELGGQCSKSDPDETLEKITPFDANRVEINGAVADKRVEDSVELIGSPSFAPKVNRDGIGGEEKGELSPKSIGSSSNSNLEANSAPTKGYGLKKWRRIRRDLSKDAVGGVDSSVILKRRLSGNESSKARDDGKAKSVVEGEVETPTPSVGSLRSVEAIEAGELDPELVQLIASGGFAIGMDSDNSEDRSSKSSTAASVPKPRHETGFGRDRGRTKYVGGRSAGNALQQRLQRGKGGAVDVNKKIREDRLRLEKENSQSSIESDLRSSNMGFMRWGSGVSNGKHSEKSSNFDGELFDEVQTSEEVRSGYYKENGVVEDLLRGPNLFEEENKMKGGNFRPPTGSDPFMESFVMLQAAQEALEKEIQKFVEIGNASEFNDLDNQSGETEVSSSLAPEANVCELNRKIELLQHKLKETSATIKARELKVLELENVIKRTQLAKETPFTNVQEMYGLESNFEELFKKKIQAEIEFLIISRTTQSWKIQAEDQTALFEEQKPLAVKLKNVEDKAIKLKEQTEVLESYCKELLGTEQALKLQTKVLKFSFCGFIQLLLLFVAFGLFLIQLMSPPPEFVPT